MTRFFRCCIVGCGLAVLLAGGLSSGWAADLVWEVRGDFDLGAPALAMAASADGEWVFFLTEGEVQVYSLAGRGVVSRIPVDKAYRRLAYSPRDDTLILSGPDTVRVRFIELSKVFSLDYGGLPFAGPAEAAVTVAVFGDYQ